MQVLYPTYGLAEHTVLVCSGGAGSVVYGREEKGVVTVLEEKVSDERPSNIPAWSKR